MNAEVSDTTGAAMKCQSWHHKNIIKKPALYVPAFFNYKTLSELF